MELLFELHCLAWPSVAELSALREPAGSAGVPVRLLEAGCGGGSREAADDGRALAGLTEAGVGKPMKSSSSCASS